MENQEIFDQIKDYLSKGKTDKALDALVTYTKNSNSPLHDEAILLSGQYSQWKRENMLGVQQTNSELRRIEMSIMDLLQNKIEYFESKSAAVEGSSAIESPISSTPVSGGKSKLGIIVGSIIALSIIVLGTWYFMSKDSGTSSSGDSTEVMTPAEKYTPTDPETTKISVPAEAGILPLTGNTPLEVDKKYFSNDGNYFLSFQADGNLVVKTKEDNFIWGSYQAGASLDGRKAIMQEDGNLVIYKENDDFVWATMSTVPHSKANITPDGILQIIAPDNNVVWQSK